MNDGELEEHRSVGRASDSVVAQLASAVFLDADVPAGFGLDYPLSELDSLQILCLITEAELMADADWPIDLLDTLESVGDLVGWIEH